MMGGLSFLRRMLGGKQREQVPEALLRNNEVFRQFDQDKPLAEYEFVVLDSELTGLKVKRDEIVSLGAVRISGLRLMPGDTYECLVKPSVPLPKKTTLVHRITPENVQDAPPIADVLPGFVEWLGGALLVGHHVSLDISFLNRTLLRSWRAALHNPCIDTMRLAQAFEREQWEHSMESMQGHFSYTLSDLSARYGLPAFTAHNALEDAFQTAYLFLYLIKKLNRGGLRTLRDVYLAGRRW